MIYDITSYQNAKDTLCQLLNLTKEQLENGENYLSIMYKNVENLKTAMQSKEK